MNEPAEKWDVAQVAIHLKKPWRKAYDLILCGRFGVPERRGRSWLVSAEAVRVYVAARSAKSMAPTVGRP